MKNAKQRPILYEKQCMKVYLNDEKTPVDLRPLYDIFWGLKAPCDTFLLADIQIWIAIYVVTWHDSDSSLQYKTFNIIRFCIYVE